MKENFCNRTLLARSCRGVRADELPRKSKGPRESIQRRRDLRFGDSARRQTLAQHHHETAGCERKIAGHFSHRLAELRFGRSAGRHERCDGLILRGLAQTPGFCLFKIDKPGCGDSEGDCSQTDFDTELAGYRAAFRALKNYDFIDSDRVYIFGSSNGGGFARLVPETESEQAQVRGYITIGGWVKTWFEHMLDIERRRFALMKKSPGEVTDRIKGATTLYYEWLIKGRSVPEILKKSRSSRNYGLKEKTRHIFTGDR